MLQTFKSGQGSIVLRVKLLDSSVTTGAGLTGLTSASSGLIISTIADNEATATAYTVAASKVETITTLGTYAAPTATKVRFKEVDATNHKGVYELHIADARFAVSNAKSLLVSLVGATNLVEADFVVQLQSDDPYTAKPANFATFAIDGSGRVDTSKFAGQTITAAAGVTLPSSVASPTNITAGTITTVTNLTNAPTVGDLTATMKTSIGTAVAASAVASVTGNVAGSVGSVTGAVGSVTGNVGGNVTGSVGSVVGLTASNLDAAISSRASATNLATVAGYVDTEVAAVKAVTDKLDTALELDGSVYRFTTNALEQAPSGSGASASAIADAVWDEVLSGHLGVGSAGSALTGAGSAGDPWSTPLPGAYGVGTAGQIVGVFLDAAVSDSASGASLATLTGYVDTEVAAIKAKTDLIPASPAAAGDIPTAAQNADALLDRDMSLGADSGSTTARTVRQALRALRNRFTTTGGTYSVYKENDTTLSWSSTLTTDGSAQPITGSDPAG